jgi:hypothetical protein
MLLSCRVRAQKSTHSFYADHICFDAPICYHLRMADEQTGFDFGEKPHDPDKPLFDPDEIREDCLALIAEARANVANLVWDAGKLKYNRILFPHVASWIPDEVERAQLCFEFAQECERIELLLAA